MSYCKKCGAYIPDGQEICLACGFDETGEKKKQSGSSAYACEAKSEAEKAREESARARAEQRRREQQEMNRKWAESEQLRRQQQEDFRRSQEEAARRAAEYDAQRSTNEDGFYRIHRAVDSTANFVRKSASDNRTLSYLSYISFLCFLPSLLGANDAFTRFHAKQGRKLFFAGLILSWIPGLNAIAWLFQLALAVVGIRNVSSGVMQELPVIGHIGEK
ncbi:MAG: hypothetical protein IJP64_00065 [Oscillospiraceae bacterium]|nr:hypothetical protein [Oscillospiraceae bacterium]